MRPEIRWLDACLTEYQVALAAGDVSSQIVELTDCLARTHAARGKVIFAGNGGSAALASHCAVDFTKAAGIRSVSFNDADLITCFANDFGYERWLAKALEYYADPQDTVVLVSSSGRSPNVIAAAEFSQRRGLALVTFSGFDATNPLRTFGQPSFWVSSHSYNVVEMTHHIWLLAACDLLTQSATAVLS